MVQGLSKVGFQIPCAVWKLNYLFLCFGCLMLYFPDGFKILYPPDKLKGRCCPSLRCFMLLLVRKGEGITSHRGWVGGEGWRCTCAGWGLSAA